MILLKSAAEIDAIRRAGRIVSDVHRFASSQLQTGCNLRDLSARIAALIAERGGEPAFYSGAVFGVDHHFGMPVDGERVVASGKLVNLDVGCRHGGWCAEGAWPYAVGEVDEERRRLLATLNQAFERFVQGLGPGAVWHEAAKAVADFVHAEGLRLVPEIVGHGIGRELHEDPQLSWNLGGLSGVESVELKPGIVLAVELGVTGGSGLLKPLAGGGWETYDGQPCVHGEMTVAITERGIDILAGPVV